jgi:hypothetical protein
METKIKWHKEACKKEALKYETKNEFRLKSNGAYMSSKNNGWYDEFTSHMIRPKNRNFKWDYDTCKKVALECKTKSEFLEKYSGAYSSANINGWYDEITSHMVKPKFNHKWDYDSCKKEALKYKTKIDFFKNASGACYVSARDNGWYDEITSHMKEIRKPNGYWTKENCKKEALKYETRKEFHKNSSGCYTIADKLGYLEYACSHMIRINKPIGYWTKVKCRKEALKYMTKTEFQRTSRGAYHSTLNNNWSDELCSHMFKNMSMGEITIMKILEKYQIEFINGWREHECRYRKKLSYDFYLPLYNLVIEYHGGQHYKKIKRFHKTHKKFIESRLRDVIKVNYCKEHDIDFLEIPFDEFDNIEEILRIYLDIK